MTALVCSAAVAEARPLKHRRPATSFILALALGVLGAKAQAGEQAFYLVPDYSPARDNVELVSAAMERAAAEDKRVLLVLGGDWCGWCHVLEDDIDRSEKLLEMLERHYVVAKVYCDSNSPGIRFKPRKQPRYGASFVNINAEGYPFLVILDSDGNRLHTQNMNRMSKDGRYSESKLHRVLKRYR